VEQTPDIKTIRESLNDVFREGYRSGVGYGKKTASETVEEALTKILSACQTT
jgi:hypothetical protein